MQKLLHSLWFVP